MLLITGGTGRLGRACKKIFPKALYPSRLEMDISNYNMIEKYIYKYKPDNIIHLAAIANIPKCEENKLLAWNINVEGTKNLIKISRKTGFINKFIYIQTACIFSGEDDFMYDEDSIPNPKHYYGITKLVAEEIVKSYNSLDFQTIIIRTNFTTMPWEYPKAFTDRYGTYLFAQGVVKGIKDVLEDNKGLRVIHICGDKKLSMYEYAIAGDSKVEPISLNEYNGPNLTKNMSLTSKYWKLYKLEDNDFNDN